MCLSALHEYLAGLAFLYDIARQVCELSMQEHPKNHKGDTLRKHEKNLQNYLVY